VEVHEPDGISLARLHRHLLDLDLGIIFRKARRQVSEGSEVLGGLPQRQFQRFKQVAGPALSHRPDQGQGDDTQPVQDQAQSSRRRLTPGPLMELPEFG
jgi:hypothetical protein